MKEICNPIFAPTYISWMISFFVMLATFGVPIYGANDSTADQIQNAGLFYQPLMWVGDSPPGDQENIMLLSDIHLIKSQGIRKALPELELFVNTQTNSAWISSLQANLGCYYFDRGLYTKALLMWESAWNATKDSARGSGKKIADFTFAHWSRLLASLGRKDKLASLFQETRNRTYDQGPLEQLIVGAREGYFMMQTQPGICYRCGTFALCNVAQAIKGGDFNPAKILQMPSPETGFSMSRLQELADEYSLDLMAVFWSNSQAIVVPSVVHWKDNHFAAIIKQKGGLYLVMDPTFGAKRWLTKNEIIEEASGHFLIPKNKMSSDFRILAKDETDIVRGKGFVYYVCDSCDGCGNGGGGGSAPGSAP